MKQLGEIKRLSKEKSKVDYIIFYSSKEWEDSFKDIFSSLYPMEDDRRYLEIGKFHIVEVSENVKK
ncbi:hypothetical protein [Clostridium sp.]|uniref:hypothetical protein n=1 Tax=Clostridium sp. TaxID=1506 RepID=UPI003217BE73